MSKLPSMPMFVDAYLADTRKLSLAERGAYTDILFFMWSNGGRILDDEGEICRMLGVGPKRWATIRSRLLNGFIQRYGNDSNGYFLEQKRLGIEWGKVQTFIDRQSERGKRSQAAQKEKKQILNGNAGSTKVGSSQKPTKAGLNRTTTPKPNKDIITSLQEAEETTTTSVAAAPDGAAPSVEPDDPGEIPEALRRTAQPEGSKAYLLETGLMKGQTPFLPRRRHA